MAYLLDTLIERRRNIFDALYSQSSPLIESKLEDIRKEAQSLILETKALCQALRHQRGKSQDLFQRASILLIEAKYLSLTIHEITISDDIFPMKTQIQEPAQIKTQSLQ